VFSKLKSRKSSILKPLKSKFVAGGNPVNNYHSQEFWAKRRFSVNGAAFFMAAFVFLGWFWRGPLGMH
jgi:hypothetical protein